MTDREAAITAFIAGSDYHDWDQRPLAGDASARRYIRLHKDGASAILMDANPTKGQSTQAFATVGAWLRSIGLSAPKIHAHDPQNGLMILEDLGNQDLASWIKANPQDETPLYTAATDVLITLDAQSVPQGLQVMTPQVAGDMLDVTGAWYAEADTTEISTVITNNFATLCGPSDRVALRDYHAENLIWRPKCQIHDRIGLLDFQDAFVAPRGYDLVSMLRDVRRVVAPDVVDKMIRYFAQATGTSFATLRPALACLGAQRNLRILGVFARLARRDQKQHYVTMIPHLWRMIQLDLSHPALADLRDAAQATLPPPESSAIKDLL